MEKKRKKMIEIFFDRFMGYWLDFLMDYFLEIFFERFMGYWLDFLMEYLLGRLLEKFLERFFYVTPLLPFHLTYT